VTVALLTHYETADEVQEDQAIVLLVNVIVTTLNGKRMT